MTALVVDTSVLVKWLNKDGEEDVELADKLLEKCGTGECGVFVPEMAKYECGNALLKGKSLDYEAGRLSLKLLYSLPLIFVSESEELAIETFRIARLTGMSYYDASFVALAKKYNAVLVTQNIKHQKKLDGVTVLSLKEFGTKIYRPFVP